MAPIKLFKNSGHSLVEIARSGLMFWNLPSSLASSVDPLFMGFCFFSLHEDTHDFEQVRLIQTSRRQPFEFSACVFLKLLCPQKQQDHTQRPELEEDLYPAGEAVFGLCGHLYQTL